MTNIETLLETLDTKEQGLEQGQKDLKQVPQSSDSPTPVILPGDAENGVYEWTGPAGKEPAIQVGIGRIR